MSRLRCITGLRDLHPATAVDDAIESIRDWHERWGATLEPEEAEHARFILGSLIEIQAVAVQRATRLGEVMNLRQAAEEAKGQAVSRPVESKEAA